MGFTLTSKITWINILGIAISIIGAVSGSLSPEQAVYATVAINVLTVILRQLQGTEVTLGGGKKYTF